MAYLIASNMDLGASEYQLEAAISKVNHKKKKKKKQLKLIIKLHLK